MAKGPKFPLKRTANEITPGKNGGKKGDVLPFLLKKESPKPMHTCSTSGKKHTKKILCKNVLEISGCIPAKATNQQVSQPQSDTNQRQSNNQRLVEATRHQTSTTRRQPHSILSFRAKTNSSTSVLGCPWYLGSMEYNPYIGRLDMFPRL